MRAVGEPSYTLAERGEKKQKRGREKLNLWGEKSEKQEGRRLESIITSLS